MQSLFETSEQSLRIDRVSVMVNHAVSVEIVIEEDAEGIEIAPVYPSNERATGARLKQHTILVGGESFTLLALLEALLFVADGPVEINQLAKIANVESETIYQGLQQLDQQCQNCNRGLRIQEYHGKFQLVTQPSFAPLIETFLNLDLTTKLSAPALETLAIIAYRQPITRAQIEVVRGVDSSAILRSLVQRALIQESGRLEGVGRPILYSVTENFMHHFGLTNLNELPTLETTEADTLWAATMLAENQAT
jgi:segregation and condensation protein B